MGEHRLGEGPHRPRPAIGLLAKYVHHGQPGGQTLPDRPAELHQRVEGEGGGKEHTAPTADIMCPAELCRVLAYHAEWTMDYEPLYLAGVRLFNEREFFD